MSESAPVREEKTFGWRSAIRWFLVLVVAVCLIGLMAYARGDDHRRGDDVGALHASAPTRGK